MASRPLPAAALLATMLALQPVAATAQAIYRIVSPDGKVTFSDRPPAATEKATLLGPGGQLPGGSAGAQEIPYELRQAMGRYPVTLYTGDNCAPCGAARTLLSNRGVPYTERTIKTAEDIEALQKLGMEATVPTATIGGQRLKGFSEGEWVDYLDAAGYPKSSLLPSGYRNPAPAPMVSVPERTPATPAVQPAAEPAAPSPSPAPGPTPDNPAGIVF